MAEKQNLSKSFKRLKSKIRKFVIHHLSERKENGLYNQINKKYKKFDWSRPEYLKKEVKEIFDDKMFRGLDSAINNTNHLNCETRDNILYIDRNTLEEEFLRREMCSYMDDVMWYRAKHSRIKRLNRCKLGRSKEYYLRGVGKKFYMGKLPVKMEKRIQVIKEFLLKKKFIFDRKSPMRLNDKLIRKLINRKLLYGSVSKFEESLAEIYREKNEAPN